MKLKNELRLLGLLLMQLAVFRQALCSSIGNELSAIFNFGRRHGDTLVASSTAVNEGFLHAPDPSIDQATRFLRALTAHASVAELTQEQRFRQLHVVRQRIYKELASHPHRTKNPDVIHFQPRATQRDFEAFVNGLVSNRPWLYKVDNERFLVRNENVRGGLVKRMFGGPTNIKSRTYHSVWKEAAPGSDAWQLLGLMKLPHKLGSSRGFYDLDRSDYRIRSYHILSGSSFAADRV